MGISRQLLRNEARKEYKKQLKDYKSKVGPGIKQNIMPFAEFFKQYKKQIQLKLRQTSNNLNELNPINVEEEDIDLNQIANINDLSTASKEEIENEAVGGLVSEAELVVEEQNGIAKEDNTEMTKNTNEQI